MKTEKLPIDLPEEMFEQIDAKPLTIWEKLNRPKYAVTIMNRAACVMIGAILACVLILIAAAFS